MGSLLRKCTAASCGEYTIKSDACPKCGAKTRIPVPARFSLEDHYGEYRRKLKRLGAPAHQ